MNSDEFHSQVLRRLDDMEERARELNMRISALETRTAIGEVNGLNVEKRLSGIEDTLKWLVRLILGAMILGGTAIIFEISRTLPPT